MRTFDAIRPRGRQLAALLAAPLLAAAATAGAADAEPQILLIPPPAPGQPRLDLSRPASPYDAGQALKTAGIAQTSIERSLPGKAGAASLGLLCGLQPQTQTSGGADAAGVDREGRFLGGQLRFGFR